MSPANCFRIVGPSGLVIVLGLACLSAPPARSSDDTPVPLLGDRVSVLVEDESKDPVTNSIGMKLVYIPRGTFTMGTPVNQPDRNADELAHEVTISKSFFMGVYEVTQKQWKEVMGNNPSSFCANGNGAGSVQGINTDEFPVEMVDWGDAVEFCKKLSALEKEKAAGRTYRLPTEAEWEYACRATGDKAYNLSDDAKDTPANIGGALGRTCKVGEYKPNAWGLYDMTGNVWEHCSDWYDADYYKNSPKLDPQGPNQGNGKVNRGGGWTSQLNNGRSGMRDKNPETTKQSNLGMRVVMEWK